MRRFRVLLLGIRQPLRFLFLMRFLGALPGISGIAVNTVVLLRWAPFQRRAAVSA
jgi:hypothetical protein